jgi:hypothetical protein
MADSDYMTVKEAFERKLGSFLVSYQMTTKKGENLLYDAHEYNVLYKDREMFERDENMNFWTAQDLASSFIDNDNRFETGETITNGDMAYPALEVEDEITPERIREDDELGETPVHVVVEDGDLFTCVEIPISEVNRVLEVE